DDPAEIAKKGENPYLVMADVKGYEISADRKRLLVRKDDDFFIFESDVTGKTLSDAKVAGKAKLDLSAWTLHGDPRPAFRQLFLDAWRLERDYFYDRSMHGLDWPQIRDRYLPLVDRVSDRFELDDVIAQMVSELSALHIFVRTGDARGASDKVSIGALGAVLR